MESGSTVSLPRMLCGLPRPPLPQPRHRCVRGAAAAGLLETTVCCHRSVHMLAPFPLRAIVPLLGCRPPLGGRRASPTTTRALDPRAPNYASVTTLELLEFPAVMEQVRPMPTAMVKAGRARGMRILPTAPRVCVTVSPPPLSLPQVASFASTHVGRVAVMQAARAVPPSSPEEVEVGGTGGFTVSGTVRPVSRSSSRET